MRHWLSPFFLFHAATNVRRGLDEMAQAVADFYAVLYFDSSDAWCGHIAYILCVAVACWCYLLKIIKISPCLSKLQLGPRHSVDSLVSFTASRGRDRTWRHDACTRRVLMITRQASDFRKKCSCFRRLQRGNMQILTTVPHHNIIEIRLSMLAVGVSHAYRVGQTHGCGNIGSAVTAFWNKAVNPLKYRDKCSASSSNIKLVHWPLMPGTARRGLGGAPHRCSKYNSPPVNVQCTNHRILLCLDVPVKG